MRREKERTLTGGEQQNRMECPRRTTRGERLLKNVAQKESGARATWHAKREESRRVGEVA